MSDLLDAEIDCEAQTAILPVPETDKLAGDAGDSCPNCQAHGEPCAYLWCQECGYYPALGTCIELSPNEMGYQADGEPESAMKEGLDAIPTWVWQTMAIVSGILLFSIVPRLLFPPRSDIRFYWAVGQFAISTLAFIVGQFLALAYALKIDDKYSPFDVLCKPLGLWFPTFADLPKTAKQVMLGAAGFTGLFGSLALVGGMPYYMIWEYEAVKKKEKNMIAEMAKHTQDFGDGNQESLEESIDDFANKGAGDLKKATEEANKTFAERLRESIAGVSIDVGGTDDKPKVNRPNTVSCVIVGYNSNEESELTSLLVATVVDGKLRGVGKVTEGLEDSSVRSQLYNKLSKIQREQPALQVSGGTSNTTWVQPHLAIRVKFVDWTNRRTLESPMYSGILQDLGNR